MHEKNIYMYKITALRDKQTFRRQTVKTIACNTKANYIYFYYMAEFSSGHLCSKWQLKMGPSCPFLRKIYLFGDIINPSLTKLFPSKWLDSGSFFFCVFINDFDLVSVKKSTKKNLANIQPSWPQAWSIRQIYILHILPSWKSTYVFTFALKYFKKWLCCFHWSVVATSNELFVNSELPSSVMGTSVFMK